MGGILCSPWAQPGAEDDPATGGKETSACILPGMSWLAVEDIVQVC